MPARCSASRGASPDDATWPKDLTAEAFLSLHQHWSTLDAAQLPGWLFTVVRNKAIDYWRRRAVEERYAQPGWRTRK